MFIGREAELKTLEESFESAKFELMILYGRRRIGKTTLITEFLRDKAGLFFVANQESRQDALIRFSQMVLDRFPAAKTFVSSFDSWEKSFEYIRQQAAGRPFILAIDEYPYLAWSDPSISSILQNQIDHHFKDTKIKIILCGSSISFMEQDVMGYESPLYGRRTLQIKVKPLNYSESARFFPHFTQLECLTAYGILGGIPLYLELFGAYNSLEEGVKKLFLNPHGFLYEETMGLLRQELREPMTYNSLLRAIAEGASKLNEISTKTGIEGAKCIRYLRTLENLHIISMELPLGNKAQKGHIYRLNDLMFRFWYRFIPENNTLIESGLPDYIWSEKILPQLDHFMGLSFESICRDYLLKENLKGKLPFFFETIGSWWGTNPVTKKQEEIDIIAISPQAILLGECKWRNEKVGLKELETLKRRGQMFAGKSSLYYILFSKSGFTQGLHDTKKTEGNLILIDLDDLLRTT